MPNISAFISTSVDDCRISLTHIKDIQFCRDLLKECELAKGQKSRITIVKRRIRQLEKSPDFVEAK
jgi:hypothetical protein